MKNIIEILKGYGLELPEDKADAFISEVAGNYKTISEFNKQSEKMSKLTNDYNSAKEQIDTINSQLQELNDRNATAEDYKTKYDELMQANAQREAKEKEDKENKAIRDEFDKYFADKEWTNPYIADGYFALFKEKRNAEENKGKTSGDILKELTQNDETAFKTVQPQVVLKGAKPIGSGITITKDQFKKMSYSQRAELYQKNNELYNELVKEE